MSGDDSRAPSELHELADEVASAAAKTIAKYRTDRGADVIGPTAHDPGRDQLQHSVRAFWNVTWISAAALIIALAAVAAAGWIF